MNARFGKPWLVGLLLLLAAPLALELGLRLVGAAFHRSMNADPAAGASPTRDSWSACSTSTMKTAASR